MVELTDIVLFVRATTAGSLSAAGRELGLSPAVASKRLARIEAELGVQLIHRTSRQLSLTEDGRIYLEHCQAILSEVEDAEHAITGERAEPHGLLKISASVAFGRHWVGPCAAEFCRRYPNVSVQMLLSDSIVNLIEGQFDLAIRIGGLDDSSMISRKLAANRRVVCAAPSYLEKYGAPRLPHDLLQHQCLVLLRPGMSSLEWALRVDGTVQTFRVGAALSTDNGDLVHDWVLAGHGLSLRSIWDVADDLAAGRLVTVLDDYALDSADIHAVYPSRRFAPAKTRLFIETLKSYLQDKMPL
ncbi:MAG: LysR family transcriptional regulator [Collimonas fungivorans]|uniref:LysR family transcriptional regulator n=1 Tax=Collimonas fungivorans TaxID=158899 RepID=UPI0026ED8F43|nr:LysR family transcriptional regulator [Collimonas fungivorans]MDB5767838.1 LysR family transcriptional regulator [Collimonas fungivorans]